MRNGTLFSLDKIYPTSINNLFCTMLSHCKERLNSLFLSKIIDLESINSTHIITRFDRKKRCLYVNKIIKDYTGLPASFYIGKTNDDLAFDEKIRTLWNEAIDKVFAIGFPVGIEFLYEGPRGTYSFQSTIIPEQKSTGHFHTVIGIIRLTENNDNISILMSDQYQKKVCITKHCN